VLRSSADNGRSIKGEDIGYKKWDKGISFEAASERIMRKYTTRAKLTQAEKRRTESLRRSGIEGTGRTFFGTKELPSGFLRTSHKNSGYS